MTRTQFFATFAALPFIGRLFKSKVIPTHNNRFIWSVAKGDGGGLGYPSLTRYETFETLKGSELYEGKDIHIFESHDYGETWSETTPVNLGSYEDKVEIEVDLSYAAGFKPGDRIFIEPSAGYQNGHYTISNNWTLINDKTGMQASNEISHSNKEYATWDEVDQTHGIRGFNWRPA